MITCSQALGTRASSPKPPSKREIPEPAPLGLMVPAELIHCTDRRQLPWVRPGLLGPRLIHPSSIHQRYQALFWVLSGRH